MNESERSVLQPDLVAETAQFSLTLRGSLEQRGGTMTRTGGYSTFSIVRRFVSRTVHHLFHARLTLLMLVGLGAFLVLGGPSLAASHQAAPAAASDDAADQYMRGMRDRDVGEVFSSLSPDMQHSLEQRTGLVGSAAVGALFKEQDR